MASSSNPPARIQDPAYRYALSTNVSNFVSVKLSGHHNYHLWKKQMVCLIKTHDMCHIVDDDQTSIKIKDKYDSLVQGWIFGSLSEDTLRLVLDINSAQDVWEKLKSCFDSTISSKQDSTIAKAYAKTKDKDVALGQSVAHDKDSTLTKGYSNIDAKGVDTTQIKRKELYKGCADSALTKTLKKFDSMNIRQRGKDYWNWFDLYVNLKERTEFEESIKTEGNSSLHTTVLMGDNRKLRSELRHTKDDLTMLTNSEGSTVLHIAAIVGNTYAVELLIQKNLKLLHIKDNKHQTPLDDACKYKHLDTIESLLDAHKKLANVSTYITPVETGIEIVVTAFSAKRYDLALKLISGRHSQYAVSNDHVLMAMATTFPSGLDNGEKLIYPSMDVSSIHKMIVKRSILLFEILVDMYMEMSSENVLYLLKIIFLYVPLGMVIWMYNLIYLFLLMVYFSFYMLYFPLWKAAATVVPPIKNIEKKKKEFDLAKKILGLVCDKIPDNSPHLYTRPILEAVCQDAYEVVDEILARWPEAFLCKDTSGYNIIQLATLHRSERIYSFIYIIGELKSIYRESEDSFNNNMLHLAGRLAPPNKLTRRTGAALQLQRELQWRQEVKKLVFPICVTKKNMMNETPEMVFTKEHKDLLKAGEQWMKTVAKSCSITAALVTTIVFAAAITVPGGSNQQTGIPLFMKKNAFSIFATANAISLFSSTTALFVFLSVLTARFAEEDFLVSLPRRLIIGLCTLFISTTAMMVAFSSTLVLLFYHHKLWVFAPICGFAFIPIAVFFVLQFPLILDLYWSTYIFKFDNSESKRGKFNPKRLVEDD